MHRFVSILVAAVLAASLPALPASAETTRGGSRLSVAASTVSLSVGADARVRVSGAS